MLFSVVFHFVTLQGHKAKPSKARGLKNEFLPRFVPKVPWLTAYWYYRYYWQKLDDIEVSLKNTGLSYSACYSIDIYIVVLDDLSPKEKRTVGI